MNELGILRHRGRLVVFMTQVEIARRGGATVESGAALTKTNKEIGYAIQRECSHRGEISEFLRVDCETRRTNAVGGVRPADSGSGGGFSRG